MTAFELRQTVRRYLWLLEIGALGWGLPFADNVAVTIAGVVAWALALDTLGDLTAAFLRGHAKAKAARKEPV